MELTELNRRLTTLSEHEQGYRAGTRRFEWKAGYSGLVGSPGGSLIVTGDGGKLFIRRNSRFNAVPEHTHTYLEICYVYEGTCPQRVNGQDVVLRQNQVLLLDTGSTHSIAALGEEDILISVLMPQDFLARCLVDIGTTDDAASRFVPRFLVNALITETDHQRYLLFNSQDNRRIKRYFQELMCEYLEPSPIAEQIMVELVRLILMELVNVYEADYTRREEARHHVSVVPIIRYIEQNFRTCTQQEVAEHFFISPNYVNTLLKRHTGMTYIQTVQAQRLAYAATLLRATDRSVEDIARESGYENLSFFYRKFQARYGKNPGEYR